MTATAIPAVVDALVTVATAALPGVTVADGNDPGDWYGHPDVLVVGHAGEDNTDPFARETQGPPQGLAGARESTITVAMALMCDPAEPTAKARRDRAGALLDDLDAVLRADPHLSGAVEHAWLGSDFTWLAPDTSSGSAVAVTFTVLARLQLV